MKNAVEYSKFNMEGAAVQSDTPLPLRDDSDLGKVIRLRRKALGMSQESLSTLSGIAQPNLSKIERGKADARLETYLKLCTLLGVDLIARSRS